MAGNEVANEATVIVKPNAIRFMLATWSIATRRTIWSGDWQTDTWQL
jgi:hypothetical protein